jgi:phosphatidylglycerol---prolipoprotein diacylglyceryl transferase
MNYKLNQLTPRKLALILGLVGIAAFVFLFYPISLVLSGQWQLQQQIDLFTLEKLDFFGTEISIGTISIRYYSICVMLGMLAGYAMALFLSRWHFIAGTVVDRLFIGLVIFGVIGARLFFVAFNWESYYAEPLNIIMIFRGGLAFFGMLIASLLYLWAYCSRFKFSFFEFTDFLAPSVLIGQVLGRFGNFFNYEAYGGPTKVLWRMFVPDTANFYQDLNEKYFHPTFLYEIIPNFVLLIILLCNYEKLTSKRSGLVFAWYLFGYGVIRYFVEFFRLDALKIKLGQEYIIDWKNITIDFIPVSQVAALVCILFGLILIWQRGRIIYMKKTMSEYAV